MFSVTTIIFFILFFVVAIHSTPATASVSKNLSSKRFKAGIRLIKQNKKETIAIKRWIDLLSSPKYDTVIPTSIMSQSSNKEIRLVVYANGKKTYFLKEGEFRTIRLVDDMRNDLEAPSIIYRNGYIEFHGKKSDIAEDEIKLMNVSIPHQGLVYI